MARSSRTLERGAPLPVWLPILLGTLTAVGPVSTDIYLPALPDMERQLQAPSGSSSMTMSAWVIGLAVGQIVIGPVTDRFGRRLPLLLGTFGYMLGAVGCALSDSLAVLCLFRFVTALMASASLVVPTACLRDLVEGNGLSRLISRLIIVQGTVPILAPTLGGLALQVMSWRGIFWATAIYGAACILLVWAFLPETLPPSRRSELHPRQVLRRYGRTLHDRAYLTNGLIWALMGFVVFTYLTAAPFLFEQVFGLSPFHYGLLFGLFAVCMIGASQVNGFIVGRVGSGAMLKGALRVCSLSALALLALALWSGAHLDETGHLSRVYLWPIVALMILTLGPAGAIGPNAMAGALANQAGNAGSASALAGTAQYVFGASASALFAVMPLGTAIPMAGVLVTAFLSMMVCARLRPSEGGS